MRSSVQLLIVVLICCDLTMINSHVLSETAQDHNSAANTLASPPKTEVKEQLESYTALSTLADLSRSQICTSVAADASRTDSKLSVVGVATIGTKLNGCGLMKSENVL